MGNELFDPLLARAPETVEEIAWAARFDAGAPLPAAIGELLELPATARLLAQPMLSRLVDVDPAVAFVSLGTHCFSGSFLGRWRLRRWAGPFDWLFSSGSMIAHCLDDDFRLFLDRSQYEPVPVAQRRDGPTVNRVQHAFYRREFGVDFVFNHHDVHEDADYGYLVRCVERLRACLAEPAAARVFVFASWYGDHFPGDARAVSAALQRRAPGSRLVALGIEGAGGKVPSHDCLHEDALCSVHRVRPISVWESLRFPDLLDELYVLRLVLAAAPFTGAMPWAMR